MAFQSTKFLSLLDVQSFCANCPPATVQTSRIRDLKKEVDVLIAENLQLKADNAEMRRLWEEYQSLLDESKEKAIRETTNKLSSKESLAEKTERMATVRKKRREEEEERQSKDKENLLRDQQRRRQRQRSKGGQAGHKGHGMSLPKDAETLVVSHFPEQCMGCAFRESCFPSMRVEKRCHVVDLQIQVIDMQHEVMSGKCPVWGERLCGTFPRSITSSKQYGDNVAAYDALLYYQGKMSFESASTILNALDVPFSPDTVCGKIMDLPKHPSVQRSMAIQGQQLLAAPAQHVDETSLDVNAELFWVHAICSPTAAHYHLSAHRGVKGMLEGNVLTNPVNVVVHDCWAPYWNPALVVGNNAVCNSHIIRELEDVVKLGPGAHWAQLMIVLLLRANNACKNARSRGKTSLPRYKQKLIRRRYEELLRKGEARHPRRVKKSGKRRVKQPLAVNLLVRLRKREDDILRSSVGLRVLFTNNMAEQAIRPLVQREKESGYFATIQGAQGYLIMLSLLETAKRPGTGIFEAIKLCQADRLGRLCPPSMLPRNVRFYDPVKRTAVR